MIFTGPTGEYLRLEEISTSNANILKDNISSGLTLLWMLDDSTSLTVDSIDYHFVKDQVVCLTEFHKIHINTVGKIKLIRFNRAFYCILTHDDEVSCKGILFFGASQLPIFKLSREDVIKISQLLKVFETEMESKDELQQGMLQMLLQRLLILCTRIYKSQTNYKHIDEFSTDIVRQFNFLVEQHFKSKHTVAEYADLLNKSPKTISNLFSKLNTKTPLQLIKDRIMLEARRLLTYTDTPVQEIAYNLGYEDIQSFSRFFKKNEGVSPSHFKKTTGIG